MIAHLKPGQIFDLSLGLELHRAHTTTLVKTPRLNVFRLVLTSGDQVAIHRARPT